jgi:hypothetical protein
MVDSGVPQSPIEGPASHYCGSALSISRIIHDEGGDVGKRRRDASLRLSTRPPFNLHTKQAQRRHTCSSNCLVRFSSAAVVAMLGCVWSLGGVVS